MLESAEKREGVKQILLGPGQLYEKWLQTGPRRRSVSPDSRCFVHPGPYAMLRAMKTLAVGILALALVVPSPARAEVSPACRSAVEVALSGYAACDMTARSKDSRRPDAVKLAGELEKCRVKFEGKFFSALGRNGSGNCTTETSTAFGTYLDGCVVAASEAAGGAALPNPSTCSADLATCETSLAACRATPTPAPATPTPDVTPTPTPTPCAVHAPYTDNGDGTVSDSCGLIWEKKNDNGGVHYVNNEYTWSTGSPWSLNGTVKTDFLDQLNCEGAYAGGGCTPWLGGGWRLPSIIELGGQEIGGYTGGGIVDSMVPGCNVYPYSTACIDPVFGPTRAAWYLSSSPSQANSSSVWVADFYNGLVFNYVKTRAIYARAVRNAP